MKDYCPLNGQVYRVPYKRGGETLPRNRNVDKLK